MPDQFHGHEVMLTADGEGGMQARSCEAGAAVEWHGVAEGAWHRAEECGGQSFRAHYASLEKIGGPGPFVGESRPSAVENRPPTRKRR